MSIQQTKKQSDLEKRLRLLRTQVYGKSEIQQASTPSSSASTRSEVSFLYQDLLKIGVLSALALGFQIVLFILLKNHTLNINLF